MTRNYDVFFVFGKEKKLHQIKFFWGVGGCLRLALVGRGDV
jgi:hypothetical protein